ncbi:Alpha/Beta hydrolase protein [Nemania sp. NC0429]|nr:Alpha/Beta hydrolase protein [Nemania sp. NC0429]
MLPRPCLSFTLPSIYDDTKLDCRLYHPPCLRDPSHPGAPWSGHAAVVAHPYAPMGGCFDDPIVDLTAGTLLQLGFLVATFNFRGAGSSEGRTSWTSKPEQADYTSVVGFLAYYVYHLRRSSPAYNATRQQLPTMLLAGYSYGAMITTRLPPLDKMLAFFTTPSIHTAEADIRLRAQHLAEAQNAQMTSPASPRRSGGIRIGGDEDSSRRSHDGNGRGNPTSEFQREERIRESVRHLLSRAKLIPRRSPHWSPSESGSGPGPGNKVDHCLERVEGDVTFRSAYLAVSPPVGVVTRLATMSFSNPLPAFYSWIRRPAAARDESESEMEHAVLSANPTLVIYGDQDAFIGHRKMREWTGRIEAVDASRFRHVEVPGAGHFWMESEVAYQLRDAIGMFATEITRLDG